MDPKPIHKGTANLKPAKKGEIRNPYGRPKKGESFADLFERFGKLAISKNKNILKLTLDDLPPELLKDIRTLKHLAAFRLIVKAAKGHEKALEMVMDRAEGKPNQFIAQMDVTPKPLFEDSDPMTPFGFQPEDTKDGEEATEEEDQPAEAPKEPEQGKGGGNG